MLDSDLAELYQVTTKVFNQAVKRHPDRFPFDFMKALTTPQWRVLRSQIVTSNEGRGGRRYLPHVFTEEGIAMLSSVLQSERAVQVNIAIMRAFVPVRKGTASHQELVAKLATLEKKYDENFRVVFDAIRKLVEPPPVRKGRKIGFQA